MISSSGIEYVHLANEGRLYYLGELEFLNGVKGEPKTTKHLSTTYKTGMFAIKNAETDNILIRHYSDSEWDGIYRKASLPPFDFSVDNCIRLELVSVAEDYEKDSIHSTCGHGITDKTEIASFLSDVRSQKGPTEAGLYDLIKKPDGSLTKCYTKAVIYGYFAEEPNLVIRIPITSFNDMAYSISIEDSDYILPETWLQKLKNSSHSE